jgi:hypothetical protein
MGALKKRKKMAVAQASEEFVAVQSMGGRMHVRWDDSAPAAPHGQLVYFAQFLAMAGIFDEWVNTCALSYTSPNASTVRVMLGSPTQNAYIERFNGTFRDECLDENWFESLEQVICSHFRTN